MTGISLATATSVRSFLLVICMTLLTKIPGVHSVLYGIQTTGVKSSYAGSISYDADHHVAYITGSTYGSVWNGASNDASGCFFAILDLSISPSWFFKNTYREGNVVQSCSSLAVLGSKAYIGGWSEEGGLLNDLLAAGSDRPPQYGLVLDLDIDLRDASETTTDFLGGAVIHSSEGMQSTEAMVFSDSGDMLYLAVLISEDKQLNSEFDSTVSQPNFSTGGVKKRGSKYGVSIMQKVPKSSPSDQNTFDSGWVKDYSTPAGIDNVAGMLLFNPSLLIIAGSAVGGGDESAFIPANNVTGSDHDGFIAFVNTDGTHSPGMRIQSPRGKDDYINGICMAPRDTFIYVAGTSNGFGSQNDAKVAFLLKLDPSTKSIIWFKQLNATIETEPGNIQGLACAVTSDGLHVYLGAVVENDAAIEGQVSEGRDDFVVAQYSTDKGDLVWKQQLGSRGDEYLSDIVTDKDGNVLIYGTSNGGYFHQRNGGTNSDVIVLAVGRSNSPTTTSTYSAIPYPTEPPVAPVVNAPFDPSPVHRPDMLPVSAPIMPPSKPPATILSAAGQPPDNGKNSKGLIVTIVVVVAFMIMACVVIVTRRKREAHLDSTLVVEYLKGFDNVEVDMKHSATGGFHGTYVNHDGGPRYYNGASSSEQVDFGHELTRLTYDPIVEQALFSIDDDDAPSLGGGSLKRQGSNYDGLMDAYNSAWGDLSQHTLPTKTRVLSAPRRANSRLLADPDLMDVNISDAPSSGWGREII